MKDKDTPLRLVRLWPKMCPDCYESLDLCREAKDDGDMKWPDYCYLPINAAYTYLVTSLGLSDTQAAAGAAELTACWLWRRSKYIYSYDTDLASSLAEQVDDLKDTDVLPSELLLHLPHDCIYIKAPALVAHTDGFFVWDDYDVNREGAELRISWLHEDMEHTIPQVLHILPGGTIGECVEDTKRTTQEHTLLPVTDAPAVETARTVLIAIQLLLYLLSENAEMDAQPQHTAARPAGSSHKKVVDISDKASEVNAFDVGIRIGSAIRKAQSHSMNSAKNNSDNSSGTRRPHVRRGHWHHYWTGPRTGEQTLILKWTAPTMIHPEQGTEDNVVVFPVKE